ncbi:MAG: hypothetical protein OSA99_18550 [Acidimicrobiales bacterium]|nr:hypothetical protein [Acidimicrobiales bacterium]
MAWVLCRSGSRSSTLARWAAGGVFLAGVFFTGQKSRFVLFAYLLVALWLYGRRRVRVSTKVVLAGLAVSVILVTVQYQTEIRGGGYEVPVEGVDTGSAAGRAEYVWARFGLGAFDTVRSLYRVDEFAPGAVRFDISPALGNVAGPIPSALPIEKPSPSSIIFAERFFPERWASGTGVPHSLPAELTWYFGYSGGLAVFVLFSLLVSRWSVAGAARFKESLRARLVFTTSIPTLVLALKAGTDGAIRFGFIVTIASIILLSLSGRQQQSGRDPAMRSAESTSTRSARRF